MPNTPVLVRHGVSVYSLNKNGMENGDKVIVEDLLRSVGICEEMDEYYLDIITGLTGCGPAYVSVIIFAKKNNVMIFYLEILTECSGFVWITEIQLLSFFALQN